MSDILTISTEEVKNLCNRAFAILNLHLEEERIKIAEGIRLAEIEVEEERTAWRWLESLGVNTYTECPRLRKEQGILERAHTEVSILFETACISEGSMSLCYETQFTLKNVLNGNMLKWSESTNYTLYVSTHCRERLKDLLVKQGREEVEKVEEVVPSAESNIQTAYMWGAIMILAALVAIFAKMFI